MTPARTSRPVGYAALAGIAATIAGAGVGHLTAGLLDPASSPVLAIGSTVIDLTPTPVKEWAVATMGTADKPVLLSVVTIATLVLAAIAGVLALRRRPLGLIVIVLLAGLATLAAVLRPAATAISAAPGLVTALVGVAALAGLMRWVTPAEPAASPSMLGENSEPTTRGVQRRQVLLGAGALAVIGAAAGAMGQKLVAAGTQVARALPKARKALAPLPAGLDQTVPGITTLQTPVSSFYRVDTALVIPRANIETWKLTIDGDVDSPFSISYDDLLAMPLVERDITLTCVSNEVGGEYAGGARWLGVDVAELLKRAGVRAGVDQILSTSIDGYTSSTPLKALTDDRGSMIAVGMNGEPLNPTHGYPARLVTPGLYGYVGATKWLASLTATTFAAKKAYWTQRGWSQEGPIKTMARIDTPGALTNIKAGSTFIAGVAWAQRRGIDKVEVQVDGGEWTEAKMGSDVNIDYWRQWYLPWNATAGQHTIAARAVDGTGAAQLTTSATPFPNGASGLHSIVAIVS